MSLLPGQIIPASMPIGKLSPDGKSVLIDENWWLFLYNMYLNSVKADVASGFLKSFAGRTVPAVIPAQGDYSLAMLSDVDSQGWQNAFTLQYSEADHLWHAQPGGTVSSVAVEDANGITGTVANPYTQPKITLSTTVDGMVKGNGTALSAGVSGTDYSPGTSALGTGILKTTTGTGALSVAVAADFPTLNQNTTGNAATASKLDPGAEINGVAFDGSSNVTVTAAAGTLTGSTLASNVTASSLTSLGTLTALTVNGGTDGYPAIFKSPTNTTVEISSGSTTTNASLALNINGNSTTTNPQLGLANIAGGTGSLNLWDGTKQYIIASFSYNSGAPTFSTYKNTLDDGAGNATFAGHITGPTFQAAGLTGAVKASRYVGATASGAPTTGTFALGDFILDQTGTVWICTTAGTPGTWVQIAAGNANTVTTNADLTGPVTSSGNATSVTDNAITNAMLAQAPAMTVKGNNTGATADEADLTQAQLTALLYPFTSVAQGVVPPSGGGTAKYLRADGTFDVPPNSGGTVTSVSVVAANGLNGTVATDTTTPAITLETTVTGILKGNGTAISAATAGTDYSDGTSSLATGILKSTTSTGALSIAVASDFPTLDQNTTGSAGSLSPGAEINGVNFTGAANITVTAAANTLTGTTLASNVTASSLTSVGTLESLTVTDTISGSINGNAATVTTNADLTGPITSAGNATAVSANAITNAMLAQAPTMTVKGNNTASTADELDLTQAQLTAMVNNFTSTLSGAAPPSGGGIVNYLRADGTWAIPAGTGMNNPMTATGDIIIGGASGAAGRLAVGSEGQVLGVTSGLPAWVTPAAPGTGTVTSVSVVSANGLAGTVATATTTPSITLSTTITGMLKGNGTAISAATSGTDYSAGTAALTTGILKSTTSTGDLSIAVAADFPTLNQNTTGSAGSLSPGATINGVAFTGASDITVAAAAGTLTGSTLASNVTASSLTSLGTLTALTVNGGTDGYPAIFKSPTNTTVEISSGSTTTNASLALNINGNSTTTNPQLGLANIAGGTGSLNLWDGTKQYIIASFSYNSGAPTFSTYKNTLDDGAGNATFAGHITGPTPTLSSITIASGTGYQNTSGRWMNLYVGFSTINTGTVQTFLGPTSSPSLTRIDDVVGNRTITLRVPPGWYYEFSGLATSGSSYALYEN